MADFWKFTLKYIIPHWKWYLSGLLALALTNLLTLEIPKLGKTIINSSSSTGSKEGLEKIALTIVALGVLQILVRSLSRIFIFWPTRKMEVTYKTDLFSNLLGAPQKYYEKFGLGDLVSRITNDVSHIRVLFAFGFLMMANFIFLGLFIFSQMLSTHTSLALVCMIPLSLLFIIAKFAVPKMHAISLDNQQSIAELTNKITEAFMNVHVIQGAAATSAFIDRTDNANRNLLKSNIHLAVLQTVVFPSIQLLSGFAQVIVLLYGGYSVMNGSLSIGDIMVFNVYITYLAFPLTAIGIILAVYQRAKTALSRTGEILKVEQERPQNFESQHSSSVSTSLLEIKNLSYPATNPILKEINLKIEAGVRTGIFGPIGSGKSLLFNLITRIYEPPRGCIFLYGEDILRIEPKTLRNKISYALQDPQLFSDTVADNILFGISSEQSRDKNQSDILEEVTKATRINDEIKGFPKKWDTQIGERGIKLSGGQKQRIALSRILLRNSDLVLLDDALSAADQITEKAVLKEIKTKCKTIFLSSHRLGTLNKCDKLYFISNGRLSTPGNFEEMKTKYPEFLTENEN